MNNKKTVRYICVWILCLLYVLPILLANMYYLDDTQRILYHNAGWMLDGRPLTELMIKFLSGANNYIYDMFPMPLLIAITLFSFVSVKWSDKYYKTESVVDAVVSYMPLAMPFFLANIYHRFDCLSITLAFSLLMIPFLYEFKSVWKKIVLDALLILASMCFYQPVVGMYLGLIIIVSYMLLISGKEFKKIFIDAIFYCISFGASTVFYKVVIAPLLVDKQGWRASAGEISGLSSVFGNIVSNVRGILGFGLLYVRSIGARQVLFFGLVWLIGGVALHMLIREKSTATKAVWLVLYCALPGVVFAVSVLPMAVLVASVPNARHLPELISMMFVMALSIVLASRKWPRVAAALSVLLVIFQMSFSYAYGNVLRSQKEYAEFVANGIIRDVEDNSDGEVDEIVVQEWLSLGPIAQRLCDLMPVYVDMVPRGIDDDGMLCGALINHYAKNELHFQDLTQADKDYMDSNKAVVSRAAYDMWINGNRVYVRFK